MTKASLERKRRNERESKLRGERERRQRAATLGTEIGVLEARAEQLMRTAATMQFHAMKCIAEAAALSKERSAL
jgi:hypothetical protein